MTKLSLTFLLIQAFVVSGFVSAMHAERYPDKLDSLSAIVENSQLHDTMVANAYLKIADYFYTSDIDTVIPFCEKAEEIALLNLEKASLTKKERKAFTKVLSSAYNNMGYIDHFKGNIKQSLEYFEKSILLDQEINDMLHLSYGYANIASIYDQQGLVEKSLEYHLKALKLKEEIGDEKHIAISLNSIGIFYSKHNEIKKALDYHKQSLKVSKELHDTLNIIHTLNNIGTAYKGLKDLEISLDHFIESLEYSKRKNYLKGISVNLSSIGIIYKELKEYDTALEHLLNSLEISKKANYKEGMEYALRHLAAIYLLKNDLVNAKLYAKQSYAINLNFGFPERIQKIASLLKEIYLEEQDHENAYHFYDLEVKMRDSIQNKNHEKAIIRIELENEYEKKAELEHVQNENEKQVLNLQRYILGLSVALLLLIGTVIGAIMRRRLMMTKKELSTKNEELVNMESEIFGRDEIIQEAKERLKVAKEEVDYKNNELKKMAVNIINKNNLIDTIKEKIKDFDKKEVKPLELKKMIEYERSLDLDKKDFNLYADKLNKSFLFTLDKQFPNLSKGERNLCSLIRVGLSGKDISSMLNIEYQSVMRNRTRLRKKLKLSKEDNLETFLKAF